MRKTPSELAMNTLSNTAVVGFAFALYEQKWECLGVALLAYGVAYIIARRIDK